MDIEKIKNVIENVNYKPNKELIECRNDLVAEFEKTKQLIIDLTHHLDAVEENYNIVNNEIGKRMK